MDDNNKNSFICINKNLLLFLLLCLSLTVLLSLNIQSKKNALSTKAECNGCFINEKCYQAGNPGEIVGSLTSGGPNYCCFVGNAGKRSNIRIPHLDLCSSASLLTPTAIPPCRKSASDPDITGEFGTRWCNKCEGGIFYGECARGNEGKLYRCVGNNSVNPLPPLIVRKMSGNFYAEDQTCFSSVSPSPFPTRPTPTVTPGLRPSTTPRLTTTLTPSPRVTNLPTRNCVIENSFCGAATYGLSCCRGLICGLDYICHELLLTITPTQKLTPTPTPTLILSINSFIDDCKQLDTNGCLKKGCNGVRLTTNNLCISYNSKPPNSNSKAGNPSLCINENITSELRFIDSKKCALKIQIPL